MYSALAREREREREMHSALANVKRITIENETRNNERLSHYYIERDTNYTC